MSIKLKTNRRIIAKLETVKHDLKEVLPKLFLAFKEACELYATQVNQTPPNARAKGFEAILLNSKMNECVMNHFPNECSFGKYKRFMLRTKGYIILFKKFNAKNMPMNIPTAMSNSIANQSSIPLFDSDTYKQEPILFFGYKKNSLGKITDNKLVYIDESKVIFTISENDIDKVLPFSNISTTEKAEPKLRIKDGIKKIN